ncbi:hypothetical protein SASPL_151370 [Salvia splendens]|uniref:Multidrug resistance protein, MATE family n=1 Tax=Salvia splendens TaxID=180675 RepID=A0A8X8W7Q2_SALSN|nr:hypothetical protein SASPL_151370 [Salvia splendens]
MAAVTLSFFLVTVISLMMVGHLGELALSSTAIAISFTDVTGFSVILGMASALETTSGQAFGAQQYERVGTQTYTAIVSLLFVCIPLSLLWIYMGDLLKLVGQDPQIFHTKLGGSQCASSRPSLGTRRLPAGLPALCSPTVHPEQDSAYPEEIQPAPNNDTIQETPLLVSDVSASDISPENDIHLHETDPETDVEPDSNSQLYMRYSPDCRKTRAPISSKIFEIQAMKEFFRFAVPSAVMVCLNSISTLYAMPFGFGAAASTRISNELGAGSREGPRLSVRALAFLAGVSALVISSCVFASRGVFGYIFSNEKEVVDYVPIHGSTSLPVDHNG